MKFKTRMINAAVAAALGTVAGAAQAVNLGADGQGQVLIYPYYTVQTKTVGTSTLPFDTYVSIVNSDTERGKAVKVRFLESKNSVEVLDFNLYLSPNDMWTAAITRNSSGNAMLRTSDTSCTAPEIPLNTALGPTNREVSFLAFALTDNVKDNTLARAKEGYLEIIQMADLVDGLPNNDGLDTFTASKHVNGVPPNCAAINTSWAGTGYTGNAGVGIPTGGLSGTGTIINVPEGTDITYDAVALLNFSNIRNHVKPDSNLPSLADVTPSVSAVIDNNKLVVTDWGALSLQGASPISPVSAVLMRNQILNEYAVAAQPVNLGTDWVITMPTKRDHLAATVKKPFTSTLTTSGACEDVTLTAYNREEAPQTSGLQFSPPQPGGTKLCWEVNVVSMSTSAATSNVLGGVTSRLVLPVSFSEGWLRMAFTQTMVANATGASTTRIQFGASGPAVPTTTGIIATYTGLPVVGFAAISYVNNSSLANYGGSFTHRYYRQITD